MLCLSKAVYQYECYSVRWSESPHFSPDRYINTINGWITMKFCADIRILGAKWNISDDGSVLVRVVARPVKQVNISQQG